MLVQIGRDQVSKYVQQVALITSHHVDKLSLAGPNSNLIRLSSYAAAGRKRKASVSYPSQKLLIIPDRPDPSGRDSTKLILPEADAQ